MDQALKIERPEDFGVALERIAYVKAELVLSNAHLTNRRSEYADAFVQALAEQFPEEEDPVGRVPESDTDTTFCVMIRKRLRSEIDYPRLKARMHELIDA